MTGCVLRASGSTFRPDEFLAAFDLPNIYAGENHLNIVVSEADGTSIKDQLADAERFIKQHAPAIQALAGFPGIDFATLDFGLCQKETALQSVSFPASFVALAASLDLGLDVSLYAVSDENI